MALLWNIQKRCPRYNRWLSTFKDTIFAVSSGKGKAGIAVIRVSGKDAFEALKTMTRKEMPEQRKMMKRTLYDVESNIIDHAMVCCFPSPKSYTGEHIVEFHVHGGVAVMEHLLQTLSSIEGLRMAEAGEFTKRAFYNDKLDLTEIEGISGLVDAETLVQKHLALSHMQVCLVDALRIHEK
jgi:tRNA modification GTPase